VPFVLAAVGTVQAPFVAADCTAQLPFVAADCTVQLPFAAADCTVQLPFVVSVVQLPFVLAAAFAVQLQLLVLVAVACALQLQLVAVVVAGAMELQQLLVVSGPAPRHAASFEATLLLPSFALACRCPAAPSAWCQALPQVSFFQAGFLAGSTVLPASVVPLAASHETASAKPCDP